MRAVPPLRIRAATPPSGALLRRLQMPWPSRRLYIELPVEEIGAFETRPDTLEAARARGVGIGASAGQDRINAVAQALLDLSGEARRDRGTVVERVRAIAAYGTRALAELGRKDEVLRRNPAILEVGDTKRLAGSNCLTIDIWGFENLRVDPEGNELKLKNLLAGDSH